MSILRKAHIGKSNLRVKGHSVTLATDILCHPEIMNKLNTRLCFGWQPLAKAPIACHYSTI